MLTRRCRARAGVTAAAVHDLSRSTRHYVRELFSRRRRRRARERIIAGYFSIIPRGVVVNVAPCVCYLKTFQAMLAVLHIRQLNYAGYRNGGVKEIFVSIDGQ